MAKSSAQEQDGAGEDTEITLIDLFATLWHYKFLIIGMTFGFAVFSLVYAVISIKLPPEKSYLPNQFTVNSDMRIKDEGGGSSLSSMLGSASALAGLAGVSLSEGATNSALALYLCSSRELLDALIEEFNLYERFEFDLEKMKSPRFDARKMLQEMMSANYDEDNGVFTVSCTNIDPQFAFDVVTYTVNYLEQKFLSLGVDENLLTKKNLEENIDTCFKEIQRLQQEMGDLERSVSNVYGPSYVEPISMKYSMIEMELSAQQEIYKQLKVQYELLKIEMSSETPVFQILSPPEIPDRKSKPSRGMLCIVYTFVGGCLSVLLSFLLAAWNNLKNDEAVMAKFNRGKTKSTKVQRQKEQSKGAIRLVRARKEVSGPAENDAWHEDMPKEDRWSPRTARQSMDDDEDDTE